MKRKLSFVVFFVVAGVIVTAFAPATGLAFSDEPCIEVKYDAHCQAPLTAQEKPPWKITLSSLSQRTDGYYEWVYKILGPSGVSLTASNFVAFLIPDCCKAADQINFWGQGYSDPGNFSYYPVGVGEPTLNFGKYIQQARVLRGTPDGNGNWKIVTNTKTTTRSTIIIKSGKEVFTFEMAVPGCPILEPTGGRTQSECISTGQETTTPFSVPDEGTFPADHDDVSFYIVRNRDRDGCIASIWGCTGLFCPNCQNGSCPPGACRLLTPYEPEYGTILEASLLRSCPNENFSIKTGSPYYKYTFNSGGVTYVYCLDLSNYAYVDPSFCTEQ
jgi:hypothetical protein